MLAFNFTAPVKTQEEIQSLKVNYTNKTPIDISSTIPRFVFELYPRFVEFIESYINHLEEESNFLGVLERMKYNLDPDFAQDIWEDSILNDLGFQNSNNLNINLNKNLLTRFLKEIFASRGSEQSFKLYFKLFFNSDCSITYPKEKLLIPSNYNYNKKHFVITTANNIIDTIPEFATKAFSGYHLEGQNKSIANISAIESIKYFIYDDIKYAKLEITKPNYNYINNEELKIYDSNSNIYTENVISRINFSILDKGIGYSKGDVIKLSGYDGNAIVSNVSLGNYDSYEIVSKGLNYIVGDLISIIKNTTIGYGFSAVVSRTSSLGQIEEIKILNSGFNYSKFITDFEDISIKTISGTNAQIKFKSSNIGAINKIKIIDEFIGEFTGLYIPSYIQSVGTGALLTINNTTNFDDESEFLFNTNVLGQAQIIQDSSTKNHKNSYVIESSVGINYIDSFIEEHLHTAGLSRYYKLKIPEVISSYTNISLPNTKQFNTRQLFYSQINIPNILTSSFKLTVKFDNQVSINHIFNQLSNLNFYKFSANYKNNILYHEDIIIDDTNYSSYFNGALDAYFVINTP